MKKEFYSRNCSTQSAAVECCLELLLTAGQEVPLPSPGAPLCIAEWGCAGGANSITPVLTLASELEERLSSAQAAETAHQQQFQVLEVVVVHEDVPTNDWAALFAASERYRHEADRSCPHLVLSSQAVGRSFYEPNLPPACVDLGFSFCALHWQSRKAFPMQATVFPTSPRATKEEQAALRQAAIADLASFLQLRAREFKSGGLLVACIVSQDQLLEPEPHCLLLDDVLHQMQQEGLLQQSDFQHMAPPATPLDSAGQAEAFALASNEWQVLHHELQLVEAPAWRQYQAGQISLQEYAKACAGFWRAILDQFFLAGLQHRCSAEEAGQLTSTIWQRLEAAACCASEPHKLAFVGSRVLLQRTQRTPEDCRGGGDLVVSVADLVV